MDHATRIMTGLLALAAVAGCNSGPTGSPAKPTKVELVTDTGFRQAGAVESSPDGTTFYAAAYDDTGRPTVFSIDVDSGDVAPLHAGEPFLYPADLAMSCDGSTLYVADTGMGVPDSEIGDPAQALGQAGGVHVLSTADGSVSQLPTSGLARAAGVVVSVDCETLYIAGWTDMEVPAVFKLPVAGGATEVVYEGMPLRSPTGLHVDANGVSWVMDHEARNEQGEGLLFAITPEGEISEVIGGLGMGRHGGVSLVPAGVTAAIPTYNEATKQTELVVANTESGEVSSVPIPDLAHPTGVAAAREAPVMVIAGEQSIHIATF
jgi:DNA-binding beta-propeller fold protein YncE